MSPSCPTRRCSDLGDIVYLQAQQMAQAMREEAGADAGLDLAFRAHADNILGLQNAGKPMMRLQVQIAVVGTGTYAVNQRELGLIDGGDQAGERAIAERPGAGDVGDRKSTRLHSSH